MSKENNKLRRERRRFITLMEVLLTLALIGLVGGVVAINVQRAIGEQRFLSDVSAVVNKLRLAQDLMSIFNTDLKVIFSKDEKDVYQVKIDVEHQLADAWTTEKLELQRKRWLKEVANPTKLPALKSIVLKPLKEGKEINNPTLRFFSGGSSMTEGNLLLSDTQPNGKGSGHERTICLPGFPHFIQPASSDGPPNDDCDVGKQKKYNDSLTQLTTGEIRTIIHNYEADEK